MFERMTFNPKVMGGRACSRSMRITVSVIADQIASGMTTAEILDEYPDLEAEDVKQALACAGIN